jgi:copper chaperone CopZ
VTTEPTTLKELPMTETMLTISGMTCSHCAQHVEGALGALPEVTARVDLDAATAEVHHPSTVTLDAVLAAVQDAGYTAVLARR